MQEILTDELEKQLDKLNPKQLSDYYMKNEKYMADAPKSFYYYMKDIIESKNFLLKDVYMFAGVSESYGGKILTMEKHTKNRDLIIRFCIAGRFLLYETNRALKLYGMNPLYAKNKRDACIIVAINNRKYDIGDIDDLLETQGLKKLSADL